jgi:lysozyme family protein
MASYPEEFVKAVNDLIDNWEGTRFVDDPHDPGGRTKFGISQASYPKLDIAILTRDEAVDIYYRDYWAKYKLDEKLIDPGMRAKCFNMGVVIGPLTALALAIKSKDLEAYKKECAKHFHQIVANHPDLNRYLQGWLRRAAA